MKRSIIFVVLAAVLGLGLLSAQSLADNSYYKRSVELQAMADSSFQQGDYDAAADYAAQAKEYANLSDQFVNKMLAMNAADRAIAAAKDRLAWADSIKAASSWPAEYGRATNEMAAAKTSYAAQDYAGAQGHAQAVLAALASVTEGLPLPAIYVVRLNPGRRDCLWLIAEYPFIYNNPLKWSVIYEANKKTFRDPTNPNLIFPGQVLQIPSISGETRTGTWDPTKTYPVFPK
jgi:nucleoid-associated protein YgaU